VKVLEADKGFAAQPSLTKFFQKLDGSFQFNRGAHCAVMIPAASMRATWRISGRIAL
jgi:hypothetical protein